MPRSAAARWSVAGLLRGIRAERLHPVRQPRGEDADAARGAADQDGVLTLKLAFARWIAAKKAEDFGPLARRTLGEVRASAGG